jgi:RNA-directed DNA polymerase
MLRIRERLSTEWKTLRGNNSAAVLAKLNPIIRGWAAYYRIGVSSEAFHALDTHMWTLAYKWAKRGHPNKPRSWVTGRYFGMFNKSRRDQWVFGDRLSGAYLLKFSWTSIVRHQMVKAGASPDDPALAQYWADRRGRKSAPLGRSTLRLLQAQRGCCPLCGGLLLHADREPQSPQEWEGWLTAIRRAITQQGITAHTGNGTPDIFRLVHVSCSRRTIGTSSRPSGSADRRRPTGLA